MPLCVVYERRDGVVRRVMLAPPSMGRTWAKRRGYGIVPLAEQTCGVRRFFVRAPDGNAINTVTHSDE